MICANARCRHHSPQGCRLFPGRSWLQCRHAQTKPSKPTPKPNAKK